MITDEKLDRLLDEWESPEPPPSLRRGLIAAFPPRRRVVFGVPLRWLAAAAALAASVAVATSVYDPTGRLGNIDMGGSDGVYVRVTRFVSPPSSAFHWWFKGSRFSIGGNPAGGVRGLAAVYDRGAGLYYGFDYSIRSAGPGFEIALQPLDVDRLGRGPFTLRGTIVPLPQTPAPVTIADGGAIEVDVFRSGKERLYLRLEASSKPFAGQFREMPLGNDQLRLAQPHVTVSGADAGSDGSTALGATVWVRVPGHVGRYLIALDPMGNPNFAPNGSARGNTLEFQAGSERIRIDCARSIATRDAPLYIWHDVGFEAALKAGQSGVMAGSAGPACYFNNACFQGR